MRMFSAQFCNFVSHWDGTSIAFVNLIIVIATDPPNFFEICRFSVYDIGIISLVYKSKLAISAIIFYAFSLFKINKNFWFDTWKMYICIRKFWKLSNSNIFLLGFWHKNLITIYFCLIQWRDSDMTVTDVTVTKTHGYNLVHEYVPHSIL